MSTHQADIEREMREDGHLIGEDPDAWWDQQDKEMQQREEEDGSES